MQSIGCLPIYGHTELVRSLRRSPALLDALTSQSPALRSDDSPTFCQASQTVTMQPQRNCTDPPGPIFGFHIVGISWIFTIQCFALCSDDSPTYQASQAKLVQTSATCCEMAFSRCWPQHQQDHVNVLFASMTRASTPDLFSCLFLENVTTPLPHPERFCIWRPTQGCVSEVCTVQISSR